MLCKIADLLVELPAAGGISAHCREYVTEETESADIVVSAERYKPEKYPKLFYENACYMESDAQFYGDLLRCGA